VSSGPLKTDAGAVTENVGRLIDGQCNDASRSLYEGITVPVFYDAEKPTRSIPLDCSLTKIA
jgi:hypothetical protein